MTQIIYRIHLMDSAKMYFHHVNDLFRHFQPINENEINILVSVCDIFGIRLYYISTRRLL